MSDLVESMRSFVRVAERGSFSAVAAEANASQTTIARRIEALEQHFGVRLLHRSTRRLALTDEGNRLLDHARLILEEVEQAEASLGQRRAEPQGVVRIGMTTALGLYYAGRIARLHACHPALHIEFLISDYPANMVREGLDLALRVGELGEEALTVRRLGPLRRLLVASPDYVARHGLPVSVADFAQHQCIGYGYGPAPVAWTIGGSEIAVNGCFRASSSEAVQRAVLSGLGIGLLPHIQVAEQMDGGQLVELLPGARIPPLAISVVYPGSRRLPPRTRAALDFLITEFPSQV